LALSCSGTSQAPQIESASEADSSSQSPAPTATYYRVESDVTWAVGVDEAPEAPDERLLCLAPTSPIESFDTDAELRRINAGGVRKCTVVVRWTIGAATVKAAPALSCELLPDYATWRSVEVRGVEGCEFTNEVGLYFLKWVEGGTSFGYSSFTTTGAEARKMLADWDPLG
jgi:hypothetical protein